LSIAVDVQGPKVVKPYVEKFGVTYSVAVDASDIFGQAFGLKAIPVTFLVDEVGIVRLRGGGPSPALMAQIEAILKEPQTSVRGQSPQLSAAVTKTDLEQRLAAAPNDWRSRLALARLHDEEGRHASAVAQLEAAAKLQPRDPSIAFAWGLALLHQGEKNAALAKLRLARDLDPDNWRIRKQIWAIEHPEKFYTDDSPDYDWQNEQLSREKRQW
jgi:tetratricopeptide (TPR) repeat protein